MIYKTTNPTQLHSELDAILTDSARINNLSDNLNWTNFCLQDNALDKVGYLSDYMRGLWEGAAI